MRAGGEPEEKTEEAIYHSVKQLCNNLRKGGLTVLGMMITNGYPHEAQYADTDYDYDGVADHFFKKISPKKGSVIYSQATEAERKT